MKVEQDLPRQRIETPQNLRTFLEALKKERPDDLLVIDKPISPIHEMNALLVELENRQRYPVVLYTNTVNHYGQKSAFPVLANVFASRARNSWVMGSTSERIPFDYYKRLQHPVDPVVIPSEAAPVHEVIEQGDQVDLLKFPIPVHHEWDPGPYITAGFVTMKWSDNRGYNDGLHRCFIRDKNTMLSFFSPAKHDWYILEENSRANRPTPVVVWLGHHPGAYFGAQAKAPIGVNEYALPGGFLGQPMRLTPSVTWGEEFLVPADAEIVIEGVIYPGEQGVEAPFGEYTRYYGEQRYNPVIHVTAVTHRRDAIWQDINVSHADNHVLGGFALEAKVFEAVHQYVHGVKAVHLPLSGCCRFLCYISIHKQTEGEGKLALAAALPVDSRIKYVIVVDDDVDVFNEAEVLWAFATRTKLPEDSITITDIIGEGLDPMAIDTEKSSLINKVGYDATKPVETGFAEKVGWPQEIVEKVKQLENYVDRATLGRLPQD
ncbi:MAG: UbiD family decarboxylase [Firmicutes bacterium]|nr:UbiD family decarboxylase [Bacillota bacterium]